MPITYRHVRVAFACLWLAVPAGAAPLDALSPNDPGDLSAMDPLPADRPTLPAPVFTGSSQDRMGAIADRILAPSDAGYLDLRDMLPPRPPAESLRAD